MEQKSLLFELKDLNYGSRTAIIAHAVYNNIDLAGDISTKGMFDKSWQENKSIDFYFNHDAGSVPGSVLRTYEDETKAYTEVKFGNWKLGDDMIAMIDAGVIKGASFGYETKRKEFKEVSGKKVRVLKEVKHIETSLLTKNPANPLAGIVSLTKSEDVQNIVNEVKQHLSTMESFCRNSNGSDETITALYSEIKQANEILSKYDTAPTQDAAPGASRNDSFYKQLLLLNAKFN